MSDEPFVFRATEGYAVPILARPKPLVHDIQVALDEPEPICRACGGDGLRLVPIRNTARLPLGCGTRPQQRPSHLTILAPCECRL